MNIAIILGYGIFNKNDQKYKQYLDKSAQVIIENQADKVIFCGGFTKSGIDVSEAQSMSNYFKEIEPELDSKIILEEKSITTLENIRFTNELLSKNNLKPEKIIVICDSIRLAKVFYFSLAHFSHLFGKNLSKKEIFEQYLEINTKEKYDYSQETSINYQNFLFYGVGMERSPEEIARQISTTILEVEAFEHKDLEEKITSYRKKLWNIE